jgi:ribose transport system ATP-binding protein
VGVQQLERLPGHLQGARIVILDEPTSALSLPETKRLFEFIATLKAQGKKCYLYFSFP